MKQNTFFEINAINYLPSILNSHKKERAVILTGKTLSKSKEITKIKTMLGNKLVAVFNGAVAQVPSESVEKAFIVVKKYNADCVISFGGGSTIDLCKAIRMRDSEGCNYRNKSQKMNGINKLITPNIKKSKLLHIAIPTTLSSSEASYIIGVTFLEDKRKELFAGKNIIPEIVIYDPVMTLKTPTNLWLSTGLRTLDHALERFYSKTANPKTDHMCLEAAKLIMQNLQKNISEPNNLEFRLNLLRASYLSMSGKSLTCLSHAIAHQLAPLAKTHLDLTAITQPKILNYNGDYCPKKIVKFAKAIGVNSQTNPITGIANKINYLVKNIENASVNIPLRIRDIGIDKSKLEVVAQNIFASPRMKNNPRPIKNVKEIRKLLLAMW